MRTRHRDLRIVRNGCDRKRLPRFFPMSLLVRSFYPSKHLLTFRKMHPQGLTIVVSPSQSLSPQVTPTTHLVTPLLRMLSQNTSGRDEITSSSSGIQSFPAMMLTPTSLVLEQSPRQVCPEIKILSGTRCDGFAV